MCASKRFQTNYLLAIDGSEHARAAVSALIDLITCQEDRSQNHVTLLSVFTPLQASDLTGLRQVMSTVCQAFQQLSIPVSEELILGYPAEKILEYAEKLEPDLIVMGAKGLRSALSIMLGGVAQQIVEYGHWPVLVVRAPYNGMRKILVAIDGSRCSQIAIEYLSNSCLWKGADIELLYVLPPAPIQVSPEFYTSLWPVDSEYLGILATPSEDQQEKWFEEEEKNGEKLLANMKQKLVAKNQSASSRLLRGDAANEIIEYSKAHHFDLIVTGSRGMNPVKGWLLGSVSRKILHYSNCSVLLVRDTTCVG